VRYLSDQCSAVGASINVNVSMPLIPQRFPDQLLEILSIEFDSLSLVSLSSCAYLSCWYEHNFAFTFRRWNQLLMAVLTMRG